MAGSTFQWNVFFDYVFHPQSAFWHALATTTVIAVASMILGTGLGLLSCLGYRSRLLPLRWLAKAYVLVVRGTPLIVQIFFIFFGIKTITGFDPFPTEMDLGAFTIPGAVVAGITALAINEGAYMSEIIRSGIDAVPAGQTEAARSVGMSQRLTMRRIVLPQAARIILPPFGNEFNGMIKATSLVAFIGVYDIFFDAQTRYSVSFLPAEYFAGVAVWYLLLTGIWACVQLLIDRRLSASDRLVRMPTADGPKPVTLTLEAQK
jgi:polar amino acid transport system permease protein